MRSFRTWSSPATTRSVPPLAWPLTVFTWAGSRASLSIFVTSPGSAAIQTWPATTLHTANWRQNANSASTILFARCIPQQFPAWNGETQPSRTLCAGFPTSLTEFWFGCIVRPPLFAKARKPAGMQRCSKPNSRKLDGPLQNSCRRALSL